MVAFLVSLATVVWNPDGARADAAGTFIFVRGKVWIVDAAGKRTPAKKGDSVTEGDTIESEKNGYAQVLMGDQGYMAIRPETKMRIDTFRFNGKEDGTEKGVFSLMKGGFRAITGVIGRKNKENYKVKTPVATIGIRGTDHEPLFIPVPGQGETALGPPGAYDKVNMGEACLENDGGMVVIGRNQVGFAPDTDTAPNTLAQMPSFYKSGYLPVGTEAEEEAKADTGEEGASEDEDDAESQEGQDQGEDEQAAEEAGSDGTEATEGDTGEAEETGDVQTDSDAGDGETPADGGELLDGGFGDETMDPLAATGEDQIEQEITSEDGNVDLTDPAAVQLDPYRPVAFAAYDPRTPMPLAVSEGREDLTRKMVFDTSGNVVAFETELPIYGGTLPDPCETVLMEIGSCSVAEAGSDPGTGTLWGRWAGGTIAVTRLSDGTPVTPLFNPGNVHYIAGPETTTPTVLPISGTYTYTAAGNTTPTDNLGGAGTLNSAYFTAHFATMTVDAGVNLTSAGAIDFTADALGIPIKQDLGENVWHFSAGNHQGDHPLTVTTTSGTTPDGILIGGFVGPHGEGAAVAYSLHTNDGNDTTVSGVVAFSR